jgi:membrane protease YdiL (CAAX protease family)
MTLPIRNCNFDATLPKETGLCTVLVLAGVGIISFACLWPRISGMYGPGLLLAGLVVAAGKRMVVAVHLLLFTLPAVLYAQFGADVSVWPLHLLVPLLVYAGGVGIVPALRRSMGWMRVGKTTLPVVVLILATSICSGIALVGWVNLTDADIGHHMVQMPQWPVWVYPFAGIGFAILNAAMEEAVFRGIIMQALDRTLGEGPVSVGVQAVPFAAFHYLSGFPNGVVGMVLVLIYGVMLGGLRRLSGGLLAPLAAHVAADLVIFSILLFHIYS